ncbi:hypothetical protein [Micromonospora sp. WMMD714]|uniref:hypothetical protein n=1 Tax=Micromonospora sp. WMMD714 TaxID=3016097 RepID=UPI002499DA6A|nr:hypothetical protein [Micromonospora sp. WMMD714]WFE63366.1 hypothetical protein O7625_08755 [Micromonospora sp. WMMD714]
MTTDPPQDEVCLLGGTVENEIVFGYPQQRAVSIRLIDCGWKREDASRRGGDLRRVTAYWGVAWNDKPEPPASPSPVIKRLASTSIISMTQTP